MNDAEPSQPDLDATLLLPVVSDSDVTLLLPAFTDPSPDAEALQPQTATKTLTVPREHSSVDSGTQGGSTSRHSAGMAIGSLISRGTGFVRTTAIGAAIGGKLVGDAYSNATLFPSMIYELLLGGVLSSVLIPLLVRARDSDEDHGEAFTQRLLTAAILFLGIATALAVLCAPLFALIARTPGTRELTSKFAYLVLPTIFFYGLAAMIAAVLNTRGHFAAPMWSPIANNLTLIAASGLIWALPAPDPLTPQNIPSWVIAVLGLATFLGIVIQAIGLLPALYRTRFRWRWRFDFRSLPLRQIRHLGAWMLCYVTFSQVGVFVIAYLADEAGKQNQAGLFIFNNAYLLMMMAHGIVAVSIMTALMPRLSAHAAAGRHAELKVDLLRGTRMIIVLLTPIAVAYWALAEPLGVTLFQWGQFTRDDALANGLVIGASSLALIPFSISQLQTFTFYALPDTKTPALLNIPIVGVRVGMDFLLYALLPAAYITVGLMLGYAVSFVAAVAGSAWLLQRRIGTFDRRSIALTAAKAAVAGGVALVAGRLTAQALLPSSATSRLSSFVALVAGGVVIGGLYIAVARLLRLREVGDVLNLVLRRLRRS